jgi:hypothetical protein
MCCICYPKHLSINRSFVPHVLEMPLSSACAGNGNGVYLPPLSAHCHTGFQLITIPRWQRHLFPYFPRAHVFPRPLCFPIPPACVLLPLLASLCVPIPTPLRPHPKSPRSTKPSLPPPLLLCRAAQHIPSTHTQFPAGNGLHVILMLPLYFSRTHSFPCSLRSPHRTRTAPLRSTGS